ncbi:MAG: CDP-alcohol phosphatidyltransferase family protein [Oscillospiraceae bacterium]|nr:CDP-alcohol phosphatidyltransferase family protein [Oscillospiraceae bacterium]
MRFIGFYDYTVILTYMSLVSAVGGMVFSSHKNFGAAIICLMISGVCDAFDGTVARTKKNRTDDEKSFGIQLDSLCDVVSFGVSPAFTCYCMGTDGFLGLVIVMAFCLCAVIRLAFFNVLETKRQQVEEGSGKSYRGLPVTSISVIFPVVYLTRFILPEGIFVAALHMMLAVVAFLFVLDFSVKKPDWKKLFTKAA